MTVNELVHILTMLDRNDDIKIVDDNGKLLNIMDILDLEDDDGNTCYVIETK